MLKNKKLPHINETVSIEWSHMDSNHGPPDYESGALTN